MTPKWRLEGQSAQALRALLTNSDLRDQLESFVNGLIATASFDNMAPLWWIIEGEEVNVRDRGQYSIHGVFQLDGTITLGSDSELRII